MKIKNKKFKKLLIFIILMQCFAIFSFYSFEIIEEASALEKDEYLVTENKTVAKIRNFETNTEEEKEVEEQVKKIQNVFIYSQSPKLFEEDNLNFRGDNKLISFKGEYLEYDYYSDDSIYYPIIFVGSKIQEDYNIKSGDTISFYSTTYTVIDNQSNCNNYTNDYCVEILSEKEFLDLQNISLKGVE